MPRPTLRQLEYLITLQDAGSFSRAAQACNVTQSTLSAGIKDLENILQSTLVNRMGRTIALTPLGVEITTGARSILGNVDTLTARASQTQSPLCGTLRLGLIPTIAPYYLPSILPLLHGEYPNLALQIHEDLSERLLDQIHRRTLDGAIIALPYDTQGLEQHILFTEEFHLAAPKNKPVPKSLSTKDITPQDLLLLQDGHCLTDHALQACKLQPSSQRKTFSATSLATLIQMVDHGYGVTLLPDMVVKNAPLPENVKTHRFKDPKPTRTIGMIWPKSSPQKRDLQTLFDTLLSMNS